MSNRYALIIGNSQFTDKTLSCLAAPDADVNDLADILQDPSIGGFDQVTTLVNQSSTSVRRAIARFFSGKKSSDLLLLYFSGHGVLDAHGRLNLAVADTERDLLRATAISAALIADEMDNSRSKRQVVILDCCQSGAFGRGTKGVLGASVGTAAAFEGTGSGRIVLTATDATQYAWEADQVIGDTENSVFTHYLIQGLRTGEADTDADGRITLDELYDYVYERVVEATPKQTPHKWSYKQSGEIVVAKVPRGQARSAELPAELALAIESPLAYVREGAVRALEDLLHGSHEGLVLAARAALERMVKDDSRRVSEMASEALGEEERDADEPQAEPAKLYRSALNEIGASRLEKARRLLQQVQSVNPDFRDTQALLDRIEREIEQDVGELQPDTPPWFKNLLDALKSGHPRWVRALLVGVAIVCLTFIALWLSKIPHRGVATATVQPSLRAVVTSVSATLTPTLTPTRWPRVTRVFSLPTGENVTMVWVSAGDFLMGSTDTEIDAVMSSCSECDRDFFTDQQPQHIVYLDAYWIDQTEVTNAQYAACVESGACPQLIRSASHSRTNYYGNPDFNEYPLMYISWYDANTYCAWRGARLPSEAEWEKAARGTDGGVFPWGNESADCSLANHYADNSCVGDTSKVGNYPAGASPYGALDMAGNVSEWVADRYAKDYYSLIDAHENPRGPSAGITFVIRGGAWWSHGFAVRSATRDHMSPDASVDIGFRCARDASPAGGMTATQTSLPTPTPFPTRTGTATPTQTPQPSPTLTQLSTNTPTATQTPRLLPTIAPTATQVPSSPTATPAPLTDTPSPPTDSPPPPTNTPAPPTNTPPPATNTPPP